jgi:hypothetical protein
MRISAQNGYEKDQNRTEHDVTSITIFLQKMGLLPKRWIFYAYVGIKHVLKHDNSYDPFMKSTILLQQHSSQILPLC